MINSARLITLVGSIIFSVTIKHIYIVVIFFHTFAVISL
jgi:hypothetical protein